MLIENVLWKTNAYRKPQIRIIQQKLRLNNTVVGLVCARCSIWHIFHAFYNLMLVFQEWSKGYIHCRHRNKWNHPLYSLYWTHTQKTLVVGSHDHCAHLQIQKSKWKKNITVKIHSNIWKKNNIRVVILFVFKILIDYICDLQMS